jgi:hypothetical protein
MLGQNYTTQNAGFKDQWRKIIHFLLQEKNRQMLAALSLSLLILPTLLLLALHFLNLVHVGD